MTRKRVYLHRDERKGQILWALYDADKPWTIGYFARWAGISVSPFLRSVFFELLEEGLIEPYTIEFSNGVAGKAYWLSEEARLNLAQFHPTQ